jgi:hypothetical protein
MRDKHALLINGSPRGRRASSKILSDHLGVRLLGAGWEIKSAIAASAMRTEDGRKGLISDFGAADTAILIAPLYVDALPGQLTEALEMLAADSASAGDSPKQIAAVLNCGFPEARQNEFAIAICRHFAETIGARWIGAVAIGGGAMIGGKPLDVAGKLGREIIAALDVLVEAIDAGEPVALDAGPTVAEPSMSPSMYARGGDMMWRMEAIKQGTLLKLGAKPYARRKT